MPALFIGHGSPMNAIEDNEFTNGWIELAGHLPMPSAVVCLSAHWETDGLFVTATEQPATIHDFYGFPDKLYAIRYPAPGSPDLAQTVIDALAKAGAQPDESWGLDHGTWSILCRMYPKADIPVVQISLDRSKDAAFHYRLGRQLRFLRSQGVLVLGSGNIVHNLKMIRWNEPAYDWAVQVDARVAELTLEERARELIDYETIHPSAHLAIPAPEHYLPFLTILGMRSERDRIRFFNERIVHGSISMRSLAVE